MTAASVSLFTSLHLFVSKKDVSILKRGRVLAQIITAVFLNPSPRKALDASASTRGKQVCCRALASEADPGEALP